MEGAEVGGGGAGCALLGAGEGFYFHGVKLWMCQECAGCLGGARGYGWSGWYVGVSKIAGM